MKTKLNNLLEKNYLGWKLRNTIGNIIRYTPEPTWIHCPESLQIDTTNLCNLACAYCNVREGGAFNIPRGTMPTEMIEYIIDYWSKHREMRMYAPFMNGEPLIDKRLPYIFDYVQKKAPHAYCLIDTNGVAYENRENLVHPNLKVVRFTISADTPETYHKVHGKPLYEKAMKTFNWFKENRLPNQRIEFHFIVTKNNEHEVEPWIKTFKGFLRKVFPLHRMPGIQENSEQSLGENSEYIIKTDTLEEWLKTRPLAIYPDETRKRLQLDKNKTCQGMSFAVQWDGTIVHCTDAPPTYNYGHVYEKDMLEAWKERNLARISNPACLACNSKRPDWEQVLNKYLEVS